MNKYSLKEQGDCGIVAGELLRECASNEQERETADRFLKIAKAEKEELQERIKKRGGGDLKYFANLEKARQLRNKGAKP